MLKAELEQTHPSHGSSYSRKCAIFTMESLGFLMAQPSSLAESLEIEEAFV